MPDSFRAIGRQWRGREFFEQKSQNWALIQEGSSGRKSFSNRL